ncbi:hypothetical protein TNIN_220081 [Trichonephila inaurata madagascariensis]|uniref:Uncharacterized protein n=1 Tax=Trichonephila inaurata madagascariensis TaxID=2747483 RepID=A0A8X6WY93_9ARAC|nr:hypothetical protein TNIN_220081 [Trichonephila inaurata madagascariensis]
MPSTSEYNLRPSRGAKVESRPSSEKRTQQGGPVRKLIVKLCAMRNEYAKKKRKVPRKAQEFVLLDNMSNRMNQFSYFKPMEVFSQREYHSDVEMEAGTQEWLSVSGWNSLQKRH